MTAIESIVARAEELPEFLAHIILWKWKIKCG